MGETPESGLFVCKGGDNMLKNDIKRTVTNQCANYDRDGQCLLDRPCPYFNDDDENLSRCSYFENCVLPGDDSLKTRYWSAFGLAIWNENAKVCQRCEQPFQPDRPKQRLCSDCRDIQRRERQRERARRYRRKAGGTV